jgi:hypothetical protein
MQTKLDFAGSTDMWSTSAGGQLMKVVNLTGFTVLNSPINGALRSLHCFWPFAELVLN